MFKDDHRELQELVRELTILRTHNLQFAPNTPQTNLLLFSEAAMVCVVLERFLRILPDVQASEDDTLSNLLDKAFSSKRKALYLLPQIKPDDFKKLVRDLRNGIVHGNYEQLAKNAKANDVKEYFKKSFASDVEMVWKVLNYLMNQIDVNTGKKSPVFEHLIEGKPLLPV